ncbi:MAG TPA: thiamine ABC transporter substrate-binding protein [Thermoplasmata archaeon]|nr:thiamine ABC transporter substrate-binding protein [Thermoplasmata archaeon]
MVLAIAIALVVVGAGFGLYEFVVTSTSETTLVVYTYPTLLNGTDCNPTDWSTVFGAFESSHGVRIELECPANGILNSLVAEAASPVADLVIGLDELTTPLAESHHLLVPYAPPALRDVPGALADELSPDRAAVPYEYGYLALDYTPSFLNATGGAVARATFPEFASNSSWARQLVTEDPTTDITGQEFLAWEVEYYTVVLHQNWTAFWTSVKGPLPTPAPDWGTAFYDDFMDHPGQNQVVVSYSTDPAYAAYYGTPGLFNSTVSWWNGTEYGWRTIYGIGIVSGTHHLALDQEFENWFLQGTVQAQIPTNEWEYPANSTIPLPPSFVSYALNPSSIVGLNSATTPSELAAELPSWIDQWYQIMS